MQAHVKTYAQTYVKDVKSALDKNY